MASNLNILALDSSGSDLSAALMRVQGEEPGEIFSVIRSGAQSHDEGMTSALEEIFSRAGARPQSISAIVVGSGPGSFTGLRIGLAFGKGLSFSLKIPLILVPSAFGAAAALGALGGYERALVIAKAGKDQYFLSSIEFSSFPHAASAACTLPGAEITSRARQVSKAALVCLDPAIRSELSELSFINAPLHLAEGLLGVLSLRAKALSWELLLKEGAYSLERCAAAEPDYVRSVAAKTIAERAAGHI